MVLRTRRDTAPLWLAWLAALLLLAGCTAPAQVGDPLPSWNEGRAKAAIIKLVEESTPDGVREYAHDRDTQVGRLRAGLDATEARGRHRLDMKSDWKIVFPFELRQ